MIFKPDTFFRSMLFPVLCAAGLYLSSCAEHKDKSVNAGKASQDNTLPDNTFKSHPVNQAITSAEIDKLSDDSLLQRVFTSLCDRLPKDYNKEYETVTGWNRSRQAIYINTLLKGEVDNGGYNQFYYNSSGQFYKQAPGALQLVGAAKCADLTRQANAVYEKQKNQITQGQDGSIEGFSKSYENNPLNKLDDKFYKLDSAENLEKLEAAYIRAHKTDFTGN